MSKVVIFWKYIPKFFDDLFFRHPKIFFRLYRPKKIFFRLFRPKNFIKSTQNLEQTPF